MGMFRKLLDKEDLKDLNSESELEEQYQKLFKKIARDFVYKEDLSEMLVLVFGELFEDSDIDTKTRVDSAIQKAIEYKQNLSKPLNQRKKYRDIIDDE